MFRRIGRLIGCVLILLFVIPWMIVLADDARFEASVNTNKITLNDYIQLTLTIHGSKGDVSSVPMPELDGFDIRFVGPSSRVTIINGVSSSEHSFVYNLFPSKVGHFTLPGVTVTLDGKAYSTSPIEIDVLDKSKDELKTDSGGQVEAQSIQDKVFMKASIEPTEVYIGQKTSLNMKVYVTQFSLQLASAPYLTPQGFIADKTASMQKSSELINGINYQTMNFQANIYPTLAGELSVGPFTATGEILYRTHSGDDLLGTLFSNVESRPITLHAPAISLHVLPLPTQNKPQDFTGAVGQFDFKASVGPNMVRLGDPLTLKMSITGDGAMKDLQFPAFDAPQFKTYDPQIKQTEESKTLEQVIIPTSQDVKQVPAISFSYFDPQARQYKTITQGPFEIKVLPAAGGQEFKAYGFTDNSKMQAEKNINLNLDGLIESFGQFYRNFKRSLKDWRFWMSLGGVFLLWIAWRQRQAFEQKLKQDQAFARRWQAEGKAREALKLTRMHLQQNNSKEFYSSLHKTINDYLADKMQVAPEAVTVSMIEAYIKNLSGEASMIEAIKALFENCDLVRFASKPATQEQMQQDFQRLQDVMGVLLKTLTKERN